MSVKREEALASLELVLVVKWVSEWIEGLGATDVPKSREVDLQFLLDPP